MKTLLPFALMLALFGIGAASSGDRGVEPAANTGVSAAPDATGDAYLTTIFMSNGGYAGNSVDITANLPLTVVGWDCNLAPSATPWTIEVYTRAGTADGFEQDPVGWTLLGTDVVIGAGVDLPTHVDIGGLEVVPGQTIGVMITAVESLPGVGGFRYTNGGPNTYSNSDIAVTTYRGLAHGFPPTAVFEYRIWNGTVHYDYGLTPVNVVSWGSLKAKF